MSRPANQALIAALRRRIVSGCYDGMEFLPSERQLAEDLATGRGSIRTALRFLQEEGLLRMVPNRGACLVASARPPRLERFLVRCPSVLSRSAYEHLWLLSAICSAAADSYAEAILSFSPQMPALRTLTHRYRKGDLQGVIALEEPEGMEELAANGIPNVTVNLERAASLTHCRVDFRQVGRLAGARLLEAGHRQIAVLSGNAHTYIYKEILAGFRGALAEEEVYLPADWLLEYHNTRTEEVRARLLSMLRAPKRPTAFFATRDHRADFLWQVACEAGLSIPGDLSVIGYDDISWPAAPAQGLTTIAQPLNEMGKAALEMLNDYFLTGNPPPSRIVQGRLIERSSILPR